MGGHAHVPFVGHLGYSVTFLIVKIGFDILSIYSMASRSCSALQAKTHRKIKALAHSADAANLVVLSDVFHDIAQESSSAPQDDSPSGTSAQVMSDERGIRFGTKVCGVCVQLWLKISLLGLARSLTMQEAVSLGFAIAMSYYVILTSLRSQY